MEQITIDLVPKQYHSKVPTLHASQYDDGRGFKVNLKNDGQPYTLSGSELISVSVRKGDNRLVALDVANTFGGKTYIEFQSTEQMCAVAGFSFGEITLAENGESIGTGNFMLAIEPSPEAGGLRSQSEINNLARQVHVIVVEELEDNGASETGYDNTESGLEATNVQDAIDEVNTKIEDIPSVDAYTKEQSDQKYATKTELSNKADVSAIPTKISQLQNDSGFAQIDDTQASASKTYSSNKITNLLNNKANKSVVDTLSLDVAECMEELGLSGYDYVLPTGYQSANYENSTHTRKFKYENNKLDILIVQGSTGNISQGEVTTSSASLTIGESLAIDLTGKTQCFLKLDSTTTFVPSAQAALNLRYYNASYNSSKTAYHYLTNAEGVLIDVVALAAENNIDLTTYPNLIIRGLSYFAHETTEPEMESVSVYGFSVGVEKLTEKVSSLEEQVAQNTSDIASLEVNSVNSSSTAGNIYQLKPYYAHLFLNTLSDAQADTYVPSQSIYDIEIAKRLGFNSIEANTHVLADGNYIVLHGTSNNFGTEFVANPNSEYTDAEVQNTAIASVSLDWVRANVIYKAKYPKMRVAPPTLQEFLYACRENNMIPYINYKNVGQVAIANEIMGKDNYVMYGAGRSVRNISDCVIASWENRTTKQSFYDWVDSIGKPCMIGVTHYENFSLSDWKDIAQTVHSKGGLMAFAYMTPSQAVDLLSVGFDAVASQYELNPDNSGNLMNISGDVGFSEFTVVGGTETDAQLTMNNDGTVTNATALSSCFLSGMWLEVTFTGSISVSMGRFITHSSSQITSAEKKTVRFSTYGLNVAPTFEVKARTNGTIIENIVFKASKL